MKGHGAHNEAACDALHKLKDFPDWVVTTAFYAAMHHVYEHVFPLEEGDTTHTSFETWYRATYGTMPPGHRPSKHEATVDLVKTRVAPVASHYRLLKDACHNARYRNYKVKPHEAALARQQLASIKAKVQQ